MEIVDDHVERTNLYEKAKYIELINIMEKTLMLIDIQFKVRVFTQSTNHN